MSLRTLAAMPLQRRGAGPVIQLLIALLLAAAGFLSVLQLTAPTAGAQPAPVTAYAESVVSFTAGTYGACVAPNTPNNQGETASSVLGPPDDPAADGSQSATNLSTSLGNGGSVTVRLARPAAGDGNTSTPDVWVWETGPAAEHYRVEVSDDGSSWLTAGESNQSTHGSQGFDVDHLGFNRFSRIFFMRITDLNPNPGGNCIAGSDIDAVGVITRAIEPALEVEKTSDVADGAELAVGDTVTYTFTVTNTGNLDLFDVAVTDEMEGLSAITPASANIAEGASFTFSATYTVTQADRDAGEILNTATATGDPDPACEWCTPPVSPPTENRVVVPQDPGLTLTKEADTAGPVAAGDVITYTFVAENTGNVTLTDVTIADALADLEWVTGPNLGDLAPGETAEGTATYTVTEADIIAGSVVNTATGGGTPPPSFPGEPPTATPPPVTVITEDPAPGLDLTKVADNAGPVALGESITYTFVATNTGNVTLDPVTITDELPGLSWVTGPDLGALAPGESATGTATYVVTEADLLAGSVVNSATVTGTPPEGCETCAPPSVTPPPVTVVTEDPTPALAIVKTSDTEGPVGVGETISYTFVVTNTGNLTLDAVTITDELAGLTWVTGPELGPLAPGESATGSATYVVTQADVDTGGVVNSATATGVPPGELPPPISPPTEVYVPGPDPDAALTLVKRADTEGPVAVGDVITYSFVATNTGNVTLADVTVTDAMPGLAWVTGPNLGALAPGESATGEATYVVTQADVDAGQVANSATGTGTPPGELPPPTTPTTEVFVPGVDPETGLVLTKSADPAAGVALGDTITYTFVATNTGNVTLADVTVNDPLPGLAWVTGPNLGQLAPGESATGTATYVVTQADINGGGVSNSATVTGTPPGGTPPPVSPPTEVFVPGGPAPIGLHLAKTVSPNTTVEAGDTLTFTFVATNTGLVTVDNVTVIDPLPGLSPVEGPHGIALAPGESATFTATYVVTVEDAEAGVVANTAVAAGTGPLGEELSTEDTARVRACQTVGAPTPTEEPTAEPTAAPTEEATEEPVDEPTAEPAETPVDEPIDDEPVETEEPIEDPIEDPTEEPIDEEPVDEPADEESIDDPGDTPIDDPAEDEAVDEPGEDPEPGAARRTILRFAQAAPDDELAECAPLPVDPDPAPQPQPQQPQRPQAPAPAAPGGGPVVATLPSTGQAPAPSRVAPISTLLVLASVAMGLGVAHRHRRARMHIDI